MAGRGTVGAVGGFEWRGVCKGEGNYCVEQILDTPNKQLFLKKIFKVAKNQSWQQSANLKLTIKNHKDV